MASQVVLLVEADILVRHPLAQYLRDCGFKVLEAVNGEEARDALREHRAISVVLADMTTPGSGFELRRWIREEGLSSQIILAGSVEKAVDSAGKVCREGPALAKPYQHNLVLEHIRQTLARRGE